LQVIKIDNGTIIHNKETPIINKVMNGCHIFQFANNFGKKSLHKTSTAKFDASYEPITNLNFRCKLISSSLSNKQKKIGFTRQGMALVDNIIYYFLHASTQLTRNNQFFKKNIGSNK
jgi:hypothetical protein